MARTTAPLFSLDASGTIAGAIVFSKWRGRQYVRRHAIPSNPDLPIQHAMRSMMRFLSQGWASLSAPDRASWDVLAARDNILPFNSYCKVNLTRWRSFLPPSSAYPVPVTPVTVSAPTIVATAGIHLADIVITDTGTPPDWGYILYRSLATIPAESLSLAVRVVPWTAGITYYTDAPLVPGTYYYKTQGIEKAAQFGDLSAEDTATVT